MRDDAAPLLKRARLSLAARRAGAKPRTPRAPKRVRKGGWCVCVSDHAAPRDRLFSRHDSEAAARDHARRLNARAPRSVLYYVVNYCAESGKAYR